MSALVGVTLTIFIHLNNEPWNESFPWIFMFDGALLTSNCKITCKRFVFVKSVDLQHQITVNASIELSCELTCDDLFHASGLSLRVGAS